VVSKSGTNKFDGSLFMFYRDEALNSKEFFERCPALRPQRRSSATRWRRESSVPAGAVGATWAVRSEGPDVLLCIPNDGTPREQLHHDF
jgi:hypothetical protein